jgi:hypothetical protein
VAIDRLSVYDYDDSSCRSFGENRDALRKLAITGGIAGLKSSWDSFVKSPGGPYSRVVFDTHGNKGMIHFNNEALSWGEVGSTFGKYNYGHIFPFFTRVYFDGCNVAEGDFGWLFLQEIAKTFCRTGGGVVFGWTSKGYTLNFWGHTAPHKWVHPLGAVRYVVAKPGGRIDDMFDSADLLPALVPTVGFPGSGYWGGGGKVDEVAQRRLDLVRS